MRIGRKSLGTQAIIRSEQTAKPPGGGGFFDGVDGVDGDDWIDCVDSGQG